MKQYRLKITWSNGDSEYSNSFENLDSKLMDEGLKYYAELNQDQYIQIDNKIWAKLHIRKFEYEEVHTEGSEKF